MRRLLMPALACLIIGLAPWPVTGQTPHLWGKLHWVAGGGHGMGAIDVFDLFLHGAPWIWLAVAVARTATAGRG